MTTKKALGIGVIATCVLALSACFIERPVGSPPPPSEQTYVTSEPAPQQQVVVAPQQQAPAYGVGAQVGGVGGGVYVTPGQTGAVCYDSCRYAGDGECDDGRPGAHTSLCTYGSDCTDCGAAY